MPVCEREGATIHYEVHGSGFPVLTLAPGGMRSAGALWANAPWNPVAELAGDHQVITMDQRNAGASSAPVTGAEDWDTYAADQLAVLDHLGIGRCHVVGMCIGGAFIAKLLTQAPDRFAAAVALQPIGLDDNREAFHEMFNAWARELVGHHPEAEPAAWDAYRSAMYDGADTLFSVPDAALASIDTPLLVLRGDDLYHPSTASELLVREAPGARLVHSWKQPEHLPGAAREIAEFLAAAT